MVRAVDKSWCCADAFQRSIISGAIYHLHFTSVADPDAIHGATEPQLQTAAERAEAKVHDSGEDTDSTSVASASQKMKIMKVSADLSAEEEQTMTALVLRQWSHCYVLIKFLLRPHSTTSSLRFLSMSKIRPRPPRSWRPYHVLIGLYCVPTTMYKFLLRPLNFLGCSENVAECDGGLNPDRKNCWDDSISVKDWQLQEIKRRQCLNVVTPMVWGHLSQTYCQHKHCCSSVLMLRPHRLEQSYLICNGLLIVSPVLHRSSRLTCTMFARRL